MSNNVMATDRPDWGLLASTDTPYGDAQAVERAVDLYRLYAALDRSPAAADEAFSLIGRSYWAFMALIAWTKDEKAIELRAKPFAPYRCYQVLADWCDERQEDGTWAHPLIFGDKSRQLMMSWFVMLRLLWIALHKPYSCCPVISKNEDDAAKMIERARVCLERLPRFYHQRTIGSYGKGRIKYSTGSIILPNHSELISLPQRGGDAFRSYVPTMYLADEAAFQAEFEKTFKGIKGTAQDSRTQGFCVTTAAPSHFQLVIEDRLDGRMGGPGRQYLQITGLKCWQNRINEVDCFRMHYTADPSRRSAEWKRQAKRGMSNDQWEQEQEINYLARGGKPIFRQLDRAIHVMDGRAEVVRMGGGQWGIRIQGYNHPVTGEPVITPVTLCRAIDHGTTNYCAAVWVAIDDQFDWIVYRTYKRKGWGAPANAQSIAELSGDETYAIDVIDAMMGLPDNRGKVEDLYRNWTDAEGKQPLRTLEAVKKGQGSRQEGLDAIGLMLHAAMAVHAPEHHYWGLEGYEPEHIASFAEESQLLIAPGCEALVEEMALARYDERPGGDPNMAQPETSVDMMDDALDCLRYVIRAAGPRFIRKRDVVTT